MTDEPRGLTPEEAALIAEFADLKDTDPDGYAALIAPDGGDPQDDGPEVREEPDGGVAFTPDQQAKVDAIVASRLTREREKWEKDNPLRGDLERTAAELSQLQVAAEETKAKAFEIAREREFNNVLERMQADPRRRDTLRKLVDLGVVAATDEEGLLPNRRQIERAVTQTFNVMPEAFGEGARPLRANAPSINPVGSPGARSRGRFTPDQLKVMSPDEINASWDQVAASLESMGAGPAAGPPADSTGP